ncbi:MAG: hypothetical protein CMJ49_02925 [Planctomycetaceae bacterium]|nr:hypothetical protein [Planctomycetaceae bacterium]
MSHKATISLVSFPTLPSDAPGRLEATLARMQSYVRRAADARADLVAFPEECNVHGGPDSTDQACEAMVGPTLSALSAAAARNGIYVVCPLSTVEAGVRHNSSALLDRAGQLVGVYHKNFPVHPELDAGTMPGTEAPVFQTDFGRVGLCICFDLEYHEVGRQLCNHGAELVVWSSMWAGARMMSRWCIEFGFAMAAVCFGESALTDVAGREIARVRRERDDPDHVTSMVTGSVDMDERLLHHDFNLDRLRRARATYGDDAIDAEHIKSECRLKINSLASGRSTDELLGEFDFESLRDYHARARRDRQRALDGTYHRGAH